jgi:hypothetical protein
LLVGAEGFEPPTFASQTQRSTRLSYTPLSNPRSSHTGALKCYGCRFAQSIRIEAHLVSLTAVFLGNIACRLENKAGCKHPASPLQNGAPGEIRTPDHLVRSQVLYPTELRAHGKTLSSIHWQRVRLKVLKQGAELFRLSFRSSTLFVKNFHSTSLTCRPWRMKTRYPARNSRPGSVRRAPKFTRTKKAATRPPRLLSPQAIQPRRISHPVRNDSGQLDHLPCRQIPHHFLAAEAEACCWRMPSSSPQAVQACAQP